MPVYRINAMLCKIFIGEGKMTATEKAAMCRQRRGMNGPENEMFGFIDKDPFFLREFSPEQEHDMFLLR